MTLPGIYTVPIMAQLILANSMLISNLPNGACPGKELIYTCISAGDAHRWTINIVAEPYQLRITVRSSTSSTITQMANSHLVNLTLISANYYTFTSSLMMIAAESLHNTMILCDSASSQFSARVAIIAGVPSSPQDISVFARQFYANSSSFKIQWTPGNGNQYIHHYHIEMIVSNKTVESTNTTNMTANYSDVPYNENVTIVITSNNCKGASLPIQLTFSIPGCERIESATNVLVLSTIFSQAPGTQLSFVCALNSNSSPSTRIHPQIMTATCLETGMWNPWPDAWCQDLITDYELDSNTGFTTMVTPVIPDNTHTHWLQRFEFYIMISSVTLVAATITVSLMVLMFCLKICHCKKDGTIASAVNNTVETRPPEPIYESIGDETPRGQELVQDSGLHSVANDAYSVKCSFGLVANDAYRIKYSFNNLNAQHEITEFIN